MGRSACAGCQWIKNIGTATPLPQKSLRNGVVLIRTRIRIELTYRSCMKVNLDADAGVEVLSYEVILYVSRTLKAVYEGVSKSFRTGRLKRELQIVRLCTTKRSCIDIFVSQSNEICFHNPLCCFSTSVYCCKRILRYLLSPESFGYTFVEERYGPKPLPLLKYSEQKLSS
jgi:hypothetical protein